MTNGKPVHVVLVPGADALAFGPDVAEAGLRGAAAHALSLAKYSGHPIDGRRPYYDAAARQIAETVGDIRRMEPDALIFAIGRNQGASILAYAVGHADDFCGLVFTGAIPELSVYRAESDLPSARSFRSSLRPEELPRIAEMRDMDLSETLKRIPAEKCLLQIGRQDDWMDDASFDVFRRLETTNLVEWVDDEHAMVSPASLDGRWSFIERLTHAAANG